MEITPERSAVACASGPRPRPCAGTGVEMEAMTAAAVAALTVYDMVKGVDRGAAISALQLLEKSGGKSGEWHRPAEANERRSAQSAKTGARHARPAPRQR